MLHVLAAEGGYQQFELGGAEWFWLLFSAATAVLAILTGLYLMRGVLAADEGTPAMIERTPNVARAPRGWLDHLARIGERDRLEVALAAAQAATH